MNNKLIKHTYFIIDFDSTIVTTEAVEELAAFSLEKNPNKQKILQKIAELTTLGMEGKMPFPTSLRERISLLNANKKHLVKLVKQLKQQITPSILRNKRFFTEYKDRIYIISGGFKECIVPVVQLLGIAPDHVLANTFTFNKEGNITGIDAKNPLANEGGKTAAIKNLNLTGEIIIIGDGYTDYLVKEHGVASKFYAFAENVRRPFMLEKADAIFTSFDEILSLLRLQKQLSYPKEKIKVLLLENINRQAVELFTKEGYQIKTYTKALSENELIQEIQDVTILGIRSKTEVTKNVLDNAPHLLALGTFSIGTNQINLPTAASKGVAVFNAPYSNTRSVVELTIGEIIMLYRKAAEKSMMLHKGKWDKSATGAHEVRGKNLGIIGYGNIGSQLSVVAESLGMNIYFYDVAERLALGNAKKCNSLKELLSHADVVTIHVDGRKANTYLIGPHEFSLMKDGVIFLNLSRGHIVNIDALAQALKTGKVAGAGIDVFPEEPESNTDPFVSPLQNLSNVILTPHIGGSTEEAQKNIGEFVANKLTTYINTGSTALSVNFPNLSLPDQTNAHRLLHVHNNIPGVLAKINKILSDHKINVVGQYLKTDEHIGYVITDVDVNYEKQVLNKLKNIPGTIRVRVLY
jgi:D-3-phosphoglycerate dehydrogenase